MDELKANSNAYRQHKMDAEGLDDFLKNANDVHKQVQDIISGKIDIAEFDREQREKETIETNRKIVEARE